LQSEILIFVECPTFIKDYVNSQVLQQIRSSLPSETSLKFSEIQTKVSRETESKKKKTILRPNLREEL